MTILSFAGLEAMVGQIKAGSLQEANARSFLTALNEYGAKMGLDRPHRLAHYLGQITHECHDFRYDREIWGPTSAQKRYDTRTDLGNTPERDGDGYRYRGRGPIQITGKSNYGQFTRWCRENISRDAPDFVADPDRVNDDPWEGLVALWYWSTRNLNRWADQGDARTITRRINGGFNGLTDRLRRTDRSGLVLLGFKRNDIRGFQIEAGDLAVDGKSGPKTRAALHKHLLEAEPLGKAKKSVARDRAAPAGIGAAIAGGLALYAEEIKGGLCRIAEWLPFISACGGG